MMCYVNCCIELYFTSFLTHFCADCNCWQKNKSCPAVCLPAKHVSVLEVLFSCGWKHRYNNYILFCCTVVYWKLWRQFLFKVIEVYLGTNLIHDFTAVTFSVKLTFFREKCWFPWNPWFFVNFSAFSLIYDNSRVLSAAFVRMLLFATCRTSALSSWHWLSWVLT